ncbi:MAG TPA: hypothetical protein DEB17_05765 [Chlorobaculum sp.]|uniref:Uncharacterized protein n=1 Tax=Chlorobaculum tepidum (strain ATCC 49652 / DSM 12025 / NBRC 103806 / TLS) TaxID=194439 RepID=Q8KF27_CHLTE|nr:hypothetical protein CT0505 [Chlorobaculum tepidum TLS]HBU23492.1 hypothetical protein [Chlorobaculum sp.]
MNLNEIKTSLCPNGRNIQVGDPDGVSGITHASHDDAPCRRFTSVAEREIAVTRACRLPNSFSRVSASELSDDDGGSF